MTPSAPLYPCPVAGCPNSRRGSARFCPDHMPQKWSGDRRDSASARGYDRRWKKVRNAHLKREPLCRACWARGRTTPADMVDHIVPLVEGGERLDHGNLQSLCWPCHADKTAADLRRRR